MTSINKQHTKIIQEKARCIFVQCSFYSLVSKEAKRQIFPRCWHPMRRKIIHMGMPHLIEYKNVSYVKNLLVQWYKAPLSRNSLFGTVAKLTIELHRCGIVSISHNLVNVRIYFNL